MVTIGEMVLTEAVLWETGWQHPRMQYALTKNPRNTGEKANTFWL